MTAPRSPAKEQAQLSRLRSLSKQLPKPSSYFTGVRAPAPAMPEGIFCFARHDRAKLIGSNKIRQHHRCVLLIALEGSGEICIDERNVFLRPKRAVMIFPFQFHSYLKVQPETINWLFITFELASFGGLQSLRSSPPRSLGSIEVTLVEEILRCWLTPASQELVASHLALLLARLSASGNHPRHHSPLPPSGNAELLARVNSYLLPRLDHPLGLKEIAQGLGQSESRLRARFREATGTSLGRHLRNLRLQKSYRLLHATDLTITEISRQCGFESVYTFSRAFKKARGISPRAYRIEGSAGMSSRS